MIIIVLIDNFNFDDFFHTWNTSNWALKFILHNFQYFYIWKKLHKSNFSNPSQWTTPLILQKLRNKSKMKLGFFYYNSVLIFSIFEARNENHWLIQIPRSCTISGVITRDNSNLLAITRGSGFSGSGSGRCMQQGRKKGK